MAPDPSRPPDGGGLPDLPQRFRERAHRARVLAGRYRADAAHALHAIAASFEARADRLELRGHEAP